MFQPPRCPYRCCRQHANPEARFCVGHGSYAAACRAHPVPRFRCKSCGRTFSRQTFRMDYHDHRPALNARLFLFLASGVGLRQSARNLGLCRSSTERKARKIGRHLRRLNLNLRGPLTPGARFQLDELETYEGRRNTRPLSVPVLIESESRFVVWAESAPIRPSGSMSAERLAAIEADERVFGRRKDLSIRSIARTLRRGRALVQGLSEVHVDTDEKSVYPKLLRQTFGARRLVHTQTNSKLARTTWNPLFPINQTEAIARDLMGRLRRESWLVSKRRRWLDVALHVFIAYRNYVRRRFNDDEESPAQRLGFVHRRLTAYELLSWRQECGVESIHPIARGSESIARLEAPKRIAA
jgi:transposase-like protein